MQNTLTQPQAYIIASVIILIFILVNVLNSIINARIVRRNNQELQDKLAEISKQLLVYSGYLKQKQD